MRPLGPPPVRVRAPGCRPVCRSAREQRKRAHLVGIMRPRFVGFIAGWGTTGDTRPGRPRCAPCGPRRDGARRDVLYRYSPDAESSFCVHALRPFADSELADGLARDTVVGRSPVAKPPNPVNRLEVPSS
jgi:hypothetical protein